MSNLTLKLLDYCSQIEQSIFSQPCFLCTAPAPARALCDACHANLPRLSCQRCPQCATPAPFAQICGTCLADPPAFSAITAACQYSWPLTPLIHQFKYAGNLALAGVLAEAICAENPPQVDLIIPMPLAPARLRERGFNQALELARIAGRTLQTKVAAHACRRIRDSAPQAMLPWRERAKNIRNAFVYDADLSGLRIAIVDDVMTTGATLNELARTLRKAGAADVHGWVVARTLKRE